MDLFGFFSTTCILCRGCGALGEAVAVICRSPVFKYKKRRFVDFVDLFLQGVFVQFRFCAVIFFSFKNFGEKIVKNPFRM